jgi:hypothetical protein
MNYKVTIRSRIGSRSQILPESHQEAIEEFESVDDMLQYIRRSALVGGWRDFEVETISDSTEGIPLVVR